MVPILNRAPGGPIAMLSSANTNVGLTHNAPWNSPGEPGIYYPTHIRNYARVAATDDFQGPAAADLMKAKKIKSVFILHDNQTFGKGVAQAFQARAQALGIKVLGFVPWDAKATSYEAIGQQIADVRGAGRLPRRHRLQQRRQAAQGHLRRCRVEGDALRCS